MFHLNGSLLSTVPYYGFEVPTFEAPIPHPKESSFFGSRFGNGYYIPTQGSFSDSGVISWRPPASAESGILLHISEPSGTPIFIIDTDVKRQVTTQFDHTEAASMVSQVMAGAQNDIRALYTYMSSIESDSFYGGSIARCDELTLPYALYNWELGLHIPMLLIDRFLQAQQFDDALAICHLVFDPVGDSSVSNITDPLSDVEKRAERNGRYWRFKPFKKQ